MASSLPYMASVTLMTVKITEIEQTEESKVLAIEGKLTNGDAEMLSRTVSNIADAERISLDLSGVTFVDSEVAAMLRELEMMGVELKGADFFIRTIIDAHKESNK
jgi:anti-anti-sigma regulatory factor